MLEETGWEPGPLTLLCAYGADVGISDARFHRDQADGATLKGPPADTTEATQVAWIPLSAVRDLLARGQLDDGASITALLYLLAFAPIGTAIKPGEPVPEAGATSRRIRFAGACLEDGPLTGVRRQADRRCRGRNRRSSRA